MIVLQVSKAVLGDEARREKTKTVVDDIRPTFVPFFCDVFVVERTANASGLKVSPLPFARLSGNKNGQ